MLVLSRKLGESIRIAEDVVIKVVQIRAGRIRLAIEAPNHVRILREETICNVSVVESADREINEFPLSTELDIVTGQNVAV